MLLKQKQELDITLNIQRQAARDLMKKVEQLESDLRES